LAYFSITLAAALVAFGCGGGEKKAEEPTTAVGTDTDSEDTVKPADPEPETPAEGDDIDSDPLPNPCAGDGN